MHIMKIAFHILRMNWYRVLSSAIDEALKSGHHVECWHNAGAQGLFENTPVLDKVPKFKYGKPKIREYTPSEELVHLVKKNDVDVVVDVNPPYISEYQDWPALPKRPYWVVIDAHSTVSTLQCKNEIQLLNCDLFAAPTIWHVDQSCKMMTRDHMELINYIRKNRSFFGKPLEEQVIKMFPFQWNREHVQYYREHSVCVGTPSFDILPDIEEEEIRNRWNIPDKQPVVALFPSPFDMSMGDLFSDLFMGSSLLQRLFRVLRTMEISKLKYCFGHANDKAVVKGIRNFCDEHDAYLVTKLRHSRKITPYVKRYSDVIVGEDGYHPHTALELYSVADLTLGFYTSGSGEAIAAGSPYMNIDIPLFSKEFYCGILITTFVYCNDHLGVVSSMDAAEVADNFAKHSFEEFNFDADKRKEYLETYTGPTDFKSSERFMIAVEHLVQHGNINALKMNVS